ncbi:MAG: zinc ribbon domain-containing protein [Candidatus Thorarchaeota archaeon]
MVYCETCGQENAEQAKFCRFCGSSLETENIKHRTMTSRGPESIGFGHRNTGEDLVIRCSLCGGQDFANDTGRLDSKWGFTSFKVVMCTCRRCGHIELFNKGRSIFDFD